ncbi:MAG TPA: DUF4157 domain-containing protein [Egibacteraceae bacterium]|nr:DUF4157 domain-containing protein [Egibacteraceae bacterium]
MRIHDEDHAVIGEEGRRSANRRSGEPSEALAALTGGVPQAVGPPGVMALQRAAGNASTAALLGGEEEAASPVTDVISSGGGQPLDADTRGFMESRMGHDFSDVRVHTDERALASAQAVNAHAYTVGSNVVFQRDRYDPGSDAGKRMLAHELTHVVQQRSGPVDGTPAAGGIKVSDPSDRFEQAAERNADAVMSGAPATADSGTSATHVQRQEEEEEPIQALSLQRQEEEEEIPEEA